jgi:hypothetical protein
MPIDRPKWDTSALKTLDGSLAAQIGLADSGTVDGMTSDKILSYIYRFVLGAGDPTGAKVRGSWASGLRTPTDVTFTFALPTSPSGPETDADPTPFNDLQKRVAFEAMWQIQQICGLSFTYAADGNATLRFGDYKGGAPQSYQPQGWCPPGSPARQPGNKTGDVWINFSASEDQMDLTPWGAAFTIVLHELGHAVGLSHAFPDGNPLYQDALNNRKYSVMAYDGQNSPTYMIGDILALRHLYAKPH